MLDLSRLDRSIQKLEGSAVGDFDPTGITEQIITAVGRGEHQLIVFISANKVGKTASLVRAVGELFWPSTNPFFQNPVPSLGPYPIFKNWPYEKNFRFLFTKENAADIGPFWTETKKWWPKDGFKAEKKGANHFKQIKTTSGWVGDILTMDQKKEQFEGPLKGLEWIDEVPKPWQISAMHARMSEGGILILTMTPLEAGEVIDVIEDLERQGLKVKWIRGTIDQNSTTDGLPNSMGTKRGLLTNDQIQKYAAGIPRFEREARLEGQNNHRAGKIFSPPFHRGIHVQDFDLDHPNVKFWNTYMAQDPHRKAYPFMLWMAVTPDEKLIIYNEWPNYDELNEFYAIVRPGSVMPAEYTIERLCRITKILDGSSYGIPKPARFIDPRYAKGTEGEWGRSTEGIVYEFAQHNVDYSLPPFEKIEAQRNRIINALNYDRTAPLGPGNMPQLMVMPHCKNTIQAFERHFWIQGKEEEDQTYKEPIDCLRYIFGGMGEIRYIDKRPPKINANKKHPDPISNALDTLGQGWELPDTPLG